ncbi:hypothetical protein P308_06460 [Pseudomonas piscis]|nr:hypothetical protein P308_06460 [Pseudomonas piscis]
MLAQGVEAQAFAGPIEQLATGLALEFGDRGARCRLRQGQEPAARETLSCWATATKTWS